MAKKVDHPEIQDGEAQAEPAEEPGYTLAELSDASGVSERTIRYYQSEKLIPKPVKRGRERRYLSGHLERITLIVELRDRGLNLQTIRDLVDNDDPTRTVASWLGIGAALSAPWSPDRPETMTLDELRGLVGDETPGLLADLHDAGFTRANKDGTWTVPSPSLLATALDLRHSGVDVEITGRIQSVLHKRVGRAVDEIIDYLVDRWKADFEGDDGLERFATTLGTLRPVAGGMTAIVLAQEVERALATLLASRGVDLAR